jgi:predicted lipoprotein
VNRRSLCAAAALALCCGQGAQAQAVAVPYYTPDAFVQGLDRFVMQPQAQDFAQQAEMLAGALQRLCAADAGQAPSALNEARARWGLAVSAWERLSSVAIGPLIERRSARQIDFQPTRPALIERAIARAPGDAQAMQLVGTPAKGLPALEWLLWTQPVAPASPACRYAQSVAGEVSQEAGALKNAFESRAAHPPVEEAASVAMGEVVNQWVGALEALRWARIEKPLRSGGAAGNAFPRVASGRTAESWASHWSTLRGLAVGAPDSQAPQPGAGPVPLALYLRGRGLMKTASAFEQAVARADARMRGLQPKAGSRGLLAASAELGALKRLVESEVAPALNINIGFSDADGD